MLKFIWTILILSALGAAGVVEDLGCTHIELMQRKGLPNALFPVRQDNARLDDVVFVYEDSYYYIYNNRFYRAFFSKRYTGEIHQDLQIGAPKSALTALWGNNYTLEKDGLVWQRNGYVVIAKLNKENRLESIWFIKESPQ
ncbi:MAG: hypothetical protein LBQ83_04555 [Candidatus Margulisbacteria bacterium]|nr:hypothetical protein [Candidatus Margulisiibacteriota bacterium]